MAGKGYTLSLLVALAVIFIPSVAAYSADNISLAQIRHLLLETEEAPTETILQYLAQVLVTHPDDIDSRCLLGISYDRLGLPDLAQEQFKLALSQGPDDPKIWIAMIKRELLAGHTISAQHMIELAHQRFPQNAEVLFWWGSFLAAQAKEMEAAAAFKLALNKTGEDVPGLRSALAEVYIDGGRYGDAVNLAQEEIKRYPNFWMAYKAQGLAYFAFHRKAAAVAPLTIAFQKLPKNAQVCSALAQSLAWCGRYDQALYPALVYLERTSTSQGIDPKAKLLVAEIIRNSSRQTIHDIDRLARMVDTGAPNAIFHFNLADILDRTSHFPEAINEYTFGLYLSPHYARGLFRLGADLECYKRDYVTAFSLLTQAYRLAPDDKQIALCYIRLKSRLADRNNDLAWIAKDWLLTPANR